MLLKRSRRFGLSVFLAIMCNACALTSLSSNAYAGLHSYHSLTRHLIFLLNEKRLSLCLLNYKADCTPMTSSFKQFHAAASLIGTKKCYNLLFVLYVWACHHCHPTPLPDFFLECGSSSLLHSSFWLIQKIVPGGKKHNQLCVLLLIYLHVRMNVAGKKFLAASLVICSWKIFPAFCCPN